MGVKVPIEVLSVNTYRLIYQIMNALDDYQICSDSQDKYDEQFMERVMKYVHEYIGKEQVKNDISNCVELMNDSDIDQIPYDDNDGWFDMEWLRDFYIEELTPQRDMRQILICHVPKPVCADRTMMMHIEELLNHIGCSNEEFMCEAVKLKREYHAYYEDVDPCIIKNWGDQWITQLVDLYTACWKEIYNDE